MLVDMDGILFFKFASFSKKWRPNRFADTISQKNNFRTPVTALCKIDLLNSKLSIFRAAGWYILSETHNHDYKNFSDCVKVCTVSGDPCVLIYLYELCPPLPGQKYEWKAYYHAKRSNLYEYSRAEPEV